MVENDETSRGERSYARFAKGVPAGFCCVFRRRKHRKKMTRQQAEYQDAPPKDIYSCGMCTLFEPPKYCKGGGR